MAHEFTTHTWTMNELLQENEMLHAENFFKLTQILDLEKLLYELRGWEDRYMPMLVR